DLGRGDGPARGGRGRRSAVVVHARGRDAIRDAALLRPALAHGPLDARVVAVVPHRETADVGLADRGIVDRPRATVDADVLVSRRVVHQQRDAWIALEVRFLRAP